MDILYLVDRLDNLIASSKRVPLTNQVVMKETDIFNIIEQMRTSIPEEVKQARRVIQEKERILAQAQADANALLNRAREETERVINREGLLKVAEQRSQEMLNQAEQKAQQLKGDADAYVIETLRTLHEQLVQVETRVSRTVLSVERGIESLEEHGKIATTGDNSLEEHDATAYVNEGEAFLEDEGAGELVEDSPGESLPANIPLQPRPRRSSLAADTIGINQP